MRKNQNDFSPQFFSKGEENMRLDKFLGELNIGTRSEVKKYIKKSQVTVNGKIEKDPGKNISETTDEIAFKGDALTYEKFVYYLLHKPKGVISATEDKEKTVIDLLKEKDFRKDIFPVGRLDKDTEGLLLLTNDGKLAHDLLSPKKHVDKMYFAKIRGIVTEKEVEKFSHEMTLQNGDVVKPSELKILKTDEKAQTSDITLVIREGKFHQVKRMFHAVGMEVTYLKRLSMGSLTLGDLPYGMYRPLNLEEVSFLKN